MNQVESPRTDYAPGRRAIRIRRSDNPKRSCLSQCPWCGGRTRVPVAPVVIYCSDCEVQMVAGTPRYIRGDGGNKLYEIELNQPKEKL